MTDCGKGGEEKCSGARYICTVYTVDRSTKGEVFGETTAVRMAEGSSAEYPPPAC